MPQNTQVKYIIIIDKQDHWRKFSKAALAEKGYVVHLQDNYNYPLNLPGYQKPDLVILGCVTVASEELNLIDRIVSQKHHLIIICTALSNDMMREMFLKGADDVADRSQDVNEFIQTIEQVLQTIESRSAFQTIRGK